MHIKLINQLGFEKFFELIEITEWLYNKKM